MLVFKGLPEPTHSSQLQADMCKCNNCRQEFKVEDCDVDTGTHDGWEMPEYTIHFCPVCDDEVMDNYFLSRPQYLKWMSMLLQERRDAKKVQSFG